MSALCCDVDGGKILSPVLVSATEFYRAGDTVNYALIDLFLELRFN